MYSTSRNRKANGNMLACWSEWKRLCALGRCTPSVQTVLKQFAAAQFSRYAKRYAHHTNGPKNILLREDHAWHLLETHLTIGKHREGKHYKEWLFSRGETEEPSLSAIESGAALLMRDVTRSYLSKEYLPSTTISLQAPLTTGQNSMTMEDLLPGTIDPRDETADREFRFLASKHAVHFATTLNQREKVILAAKGLGVAISHPKVEEVAGCRKSVLSTTYRHIYERLAAFLRNLYPEDDIGTLRILTLMTSQQLTDTILTWAHSHEEAAPILSLVKTP